MIDTIVKALGDKADYFLKFSNPKICKDRLHIPGPDWVNRVFAQTDRNNRVLVVRRGDDNGVNLFVS